MDDIICKLISTGNHRDLELRPGDSIIIGRNRTTRIKDISCSRNYCQAKFIDSDRLEVEFLKTKNEKKIFRSGEIISGPGFGYKIKIIGDRSKKDNESREDLSMSWTEHESGRILIGRLSGGGQPSTKIAAFDFDGTLVCTKNGKSPFPIDSNDWKLFHPKLPKYLDQLCRQNGYRFLVISNQLGISKGKVTVKEIQKRFESSLKSIGVPCLILIATHDDINRKPRIGLWEYFCQEIQPGTPVDMKKSFYVGDAAGRKKTAMQKADFSSSDLLFAKNSGLNFLLPEQFVERSIKNYFDHFPSFPLPEKCFQPPISSNESNFLLKNLQTGEKIKDIRKILPSKPHCIIFCGLAGSGKSTFYQNHLEPLGYVHISLDLHKSATKCISIAKTIFEKNEKNCVIDNTNVDRDSRAKWLDLCHKYHIVPIILYFHLPIEHIFHNNKFRSLENRSASVSDVVIYTQNKKLKPPQPDECENIFQVNFVPYHPDERQKKLYQMYLIEK